MPTGQVVVFQSRNRDACHFRRHRRRTSLSSPSSFNLAIEMLVISGACRHPESCQPHPGFNLAIEMLVISGRRHVMRRKRASLVSISQSRCLSFQVPFVIARQEKCLPCFNLAIEMLVISGRNAGIKCEQRALFQSRNRDACHFRQ